MREISRLLDSPIGNPGVLSFKGTGVLRPAPLTPLRFSVSYVGVTPPTRSFDAEKGRIEALSLLVAGRPLG